MSATPMNAPAPGGKDSKLPSQVVAPIVVMGVVIVALLAIAIVFGLQASAPPPRSLTLWGVPLVGGSSAALTVVDTNVDTAGFVGFVAPVGSIGPKNTLGKTKGHSGSNPVYPGQIDIPFTSVAGRSGTQVNIPNLEPNTPYQAFLWAVNVKGAHRSKFPLTCVFSTAAAFVPGPVTNLTVQDITASSPPSVSSASGQPVAVKGWSTLQVKWDLMETPAFPKTAYSYIITANGVPVSPALSIALSYFSVPSGETFLAVPSGLPVTVSMQAVLRDGGPNAGVQGYGVGECMLPAGPVVLAPPIVGMVPPAGPAPGYQAPGGSTTACTFRG